MLQEKINGELDVTLPDSFHIMTEEELMEAYLADNKDRWGARSEEDHIILAVFYHKSGGLLSRLADPKGVAKSTERRLHLGMNSLGYKKTGDLEDTLCGLPAYGFTYTYANQGVDQLGQVLVFMKDRVCYTVYTYTRPELAEKSGPIIRAFLDSMTF